MPGVVARTATHAFVNAAVPYIEEIANKGVAKAILDNEAIAKAVNTHNGELVHLSLLSEGGHDGLD
jgi:alanine dehydrogenase